MEQKLSKKTRTESDLIGSREVPESALYGVQTLRGIENFRISKFHLSIPCLFRHWPSLKWELPLPTVNWIY